MNDRGITAVQIFGKEYPIASDQNPEYVRRLAEFVDKKMNEVAVGAEAVPASRLAVLTCLTIADDLMRARSEKEQLIRLIEGRLSTLIRMIEERLAS